MIQSDEHKLVVAILWRFPEKSSLYNTWMSKVPSHVQLRILDDYHIDQPLADDIDLLVTHMHYRWDELVILNNAMQQQRVGVLVLADGIIEYRNTWQNENIPSGSLMQPAFAHKIATIGLAQSRVFQSWGNLGKCEAVGLPRLDAVLEKNEWWADQWQTIGSVDVEAKVATIKPENQPVNILVCSARTPAFDDQQWQVALQQFRDLKDYFDACGNQVAGRTVKVNWRLAKRLKDELGIVSDPESSLTLTQMIENSDVVITSPSTVQLEAMAARKPVAILDYFNVPKYVGAAWQISSEVQMSSVVSDLVDPPLQKMSFQNLELSNQLWTVNSSEDRIWKLITSMADTARTNRLQNRNQVFPAHILENQTWGQQLPDRQFDLAALYPGMRALQVKAESESVGLRELVEVQAALLRAKQYSEERSQLRHLEQTNQEMLANYTKFLDEKSEFIDFQGLKVEELKKKAIENESLLEQRNLAFDRVQQDFAKQAEERKFDHQKLTDAYADAKQKQARVNELREANQSLRDVNKELQEKLQLANRKLANGNDDNAKERVESLLAENEGINQRMDELIRERADVYAKLKTANAFLSQQRETVNTLEATSDSKNLIRRIEELVDERKELYQKLKVANEEVAKNRSGTHGRDHH